MKTTKKTLGTLIAAGFLMGSLAHASVYDVTFGTDNDGSGDFTNAVTAGAGLSWSDTTDSLQLSQVAGNGLENSSALTQLALDRSVGSEYQFTMVFSWDVGYAGNNNRFGMQMFADDSAVAGENEGIVAHWNVAASQWTVGGGVNDYTYTTGSGNGPTASFNADEYTIDGTVSFLAGDVLNAEFSIIAPDTTTYTTGGVFTASAMTGDWFGLVGRNRSTGGANEINVKSFTVVPEPATVGMFGFMGLALIFVRRYARRWKD